MRERCYGRIGNRSDNAFRLRKFAKMYDTEQTGYVRSTLYSCSALKLCNSGHVVISLQSFLYFCCAQRC